MFSAARWKKDAVSLGAFFTYVVESHVNEPLANMGPHQGSMTSELGDQGEVFFFSKFHLEDGDLPPPRSSLH